MPKLKQAEESLRRLGQRLRAARLRRNDTMAAFAERLGVSDQTVRAMEHGLPTVQVGTWLRALSALDELAPIDRLLEPRDSPVERSKAPHQPLRQRASRRRR